MKKRDVPLQSELLLLESLYEQVDVGEPLFSALVESCRRVPASLGGSRLVLVGQALHHAQENGLSHQEALLQIQSHVNQSRLSELFSGILHQSALGGDIQQTLCEWISYRMFEIYALLEQRVEQAPIKLLLPLFAFTFVGAVLLMGAALLSVIGGG